MTTLLAMFSLALLRSRSGVTSQNDTFDFSNTFDNGYLALLEDI